MKTKDKGHNSSLVLCCSKERTRDHHTSQEADAQHKKNLPSN